MDEPNPEQRFQVTMTDNLKPTEGTAAPAGTAPNGEAAVVIDPAAGREPVAVAEATGPVEGAGVTSTSPSMTSYRFPSSGRRAYSS